MRPLQFSLAVLLLAAGCQETLLREKAAKLASTTPDLYQQQILDNLARATSSPEALPYFFIPTQGAEQIAQTLQLQYTPGWDFITAPGVYLGRYLFDKQTAQVQGAHQNQETWQALPISDPDKLILMRSALHKALGVEDEHFPDLMLFFSTYAKWAKFWELVEPGWIGTGCKKDVPKCACWVGHYCDSYVWVLPGQQDKLARLTLAVLDILTIDGNGASANLATLQAAAITFSLTDKQIIALPNPPATDVVKNRLRDLIGIKYKSLGEFRQAIRAVLPGVKEEDIQTILADLAPPKEKTIIQVPDFSKLTDSFIKESLTDPVFTDSVKKQLLAANFRGVRTHGEARNTILESLKLATTDEPLGEIIRKLEEVLPKKSVEVETFVTPKAPAVFQITPRITPTPVAPPPASTPP